MAAAAVADVAALPVFGGTDVAGEGCSDWSFAAVGLVVIVVELEATAGPAPATAVPGVAGAALELAPDPLGLPVRL
jgi:hypothetical protein